MVYKVVIDPRAFLDIQKAVDYYDEQQPGLGRKFEKTLNRHLLTLEKNPYFRIRYDQVHCLPIKKFPFMIHFTINKKKLVVAVMAVLHTAKNPDNWKERI